MIEFYNTIFIKECKEMLCAKLEHGANTADAGPASSQVTPPASPVRPVRTIARNVSISPLTQERGYNIDMTPRTTRLYTFERASIGQVGRPSVFSRWQCLLRCSSLRACACASQGSNTRSVCVFMCADVSNRQTDTHTHKHRCLACLSIPPAGRGGSKEVFG